MVREFRDFLLQGNVIDMAVGFIFGAAFGTVIKSLVDNIMMPPLGELLGGVDFKNLFIPLDGNTYESLAALEAAGAPAIKYGVFVNDSIAFIMLGLGVFFMVRAITKMQKQAQEDGEQSQSDEVVLLTEIRDLMKKSAPKKAPAKKAAAK